MPRKTHLSDRSDPVTSPPMLRLYSAPETQERSEISWGDFVVTVQGSILCLDQAIAKVGMAHLQCSPGAETPLKVLWTNMIRTPIAPGNEGTLARGEFI